MRLERLQPPHALFLVGDVAAKEPKQALELLVGAGALAVGARFHNGIAGVAVLIGVAALLGGATLRLADGDEGRTANDHCSP